MVKTKDSGKRDRFITGAQRDTQTGKPRFDLIPIEDLDEAQRELSGVWFAATIDRSEDPIYGFLPTDDKDGLYSEWPFEDQHPDYRPDLIPGIMLNRLAHLYGRGARKYGDNNWAKGINLFRIYASLIRHLFQWFVGDTSEDHMTAVIWNATAIIWTENEIAEKRLPEELADAGPLKGRP